MRAAAAVPQRAPRRAPDPAPSLSAVCFNCGLPRDTQIFDRSSIVPLTRGELVLAEFRLPPQYCGVLEYFAQFWQPYSESPADVITPNLQWGLYVNRRPLEPYGELRHIINPWGEGSFQVTLRLDDSAHVELVVRNQGETRFETLIGGRIGGRYWYNSLYGDVVRGG